MSRASVWIASSVALFVSATIGSPAAAQTFSRPVACTSCIANWYYFDETAGTGTSDWNCGSSSYDGHRGSDFSLSGGNGAIAAGNDVVAAADGVVRSTIDGFFDHCTACPAAGADASCGLGFGGGFGNHVLIDHGSYTVVYAHMRTGSIRVAPGDRVTCGQTIGQIGSSGCTTGAHLHFEPRPLAGGYLTAFDPFAGSCSPIGSSLWVGQGSYRSMPTSTCGPPPPPTCPSGWYDIWTCEGSTRRRCVAGVTMVDDCSPGRCESRAVGTDDACDADGDSYATDEGDCDDHDASTHPGGTDVCGDGRDQDCSGGDAICPGTDAGPGTDAAAGTDAGETVDASAGRDAGPGFDGGPPPDGAIAPRDGGGLDGSRTDGGASRPSLMGGCGCTVADGAHDRRERGMAFVLAGIASILARRRRSTARRLA